MEVATKAEGPVVFGALQIDASACQIRAGNTPYQAPKRIINLLDHLARAERAGLSQQELKARFWPHLPSEDADNSLKVAVCQTNRILRTLDVNVRIANVRKQRIAPGKYFLQTP